MYRYKMSMAQLPLNCTQQHTYKGFVYTYTEALYSSLSVHNWSQLANRPRSRQY